MTTCKCGKTKLGPLKATVPCSLEIGCPFCKDTVKVTA
jgi:hypothetical protein